MVIDAWVDGQFLLFVTPSILEEYHRVIAELGSDRDELIALEWIDLLVELCHVIPDSSKKRTYSRDPYDDQFIDCAINAKANYLITGDKDLASITSSFNFKIISASKFLSRLSKKDYQK